jgi:deoxyribonuclease IV
VTASNSKTAQPPGESPLIGAQIKTAGGFFLVPQRAVEIGAEVVQIFNSNARMWRPKPYDPHEIAALRSGLDEHRLPLFFHAIYLINLASPDEELRAKSGVALAEALFIAAVARAEGTVIHVGSHRGEGFVPACTWVAQTVRMAREAALERLQTVSPDSSLPELLLETSAGSGNTIGKDLAQLQVMADSLSPGCGICLDTAHLFAAGLPVHTEEGLEQVVAELRERDLLHRVRLIHLNDSTTAFASARDHHENLGQGQIGFDGLARVVRHPAFRKIPFVLEVPGAEGHGPDLASVETAKSMRAAAADRQGGPALPA